MYTHHHEIHVVQQVAEAVIPSLSASQSVNPGKLTHWSLFEEKMEQELLFEHKIQTIQEVGEEIKLTIHETSIMYFWSSKNRGWTTLEIRNINDSTAHLKRDAKWFKYLAMWTTSGRKKYNVLNSHREIWSFSSAKLQNFPRKKYISPRTDYWMGVKKQFALLRKNITMPILSWISHPVALFFTKSPEMAHYGPNDVCVTLLLGYSLQLVNLRPSQKVDNITPQNRSSQFGDLLSGNYC